ncbi:hypothetical protein ACP4OV_020615 [Aristida adscensionis]
MSRVGWRLAVCRGGGMAANVRSCWGTQGSRRRSKLEKTTEDVLDGLAVYDLSKRPEVRIINRYAVVRTCIMFVFKAVGSLALVWSSVVLLGGFVTLLKKEDFWYLTFISLVQAAGLFNVLADDQFKLIVDRLLSPASLLDSWIEKLAIYVWSKWTSLRRHREPEGATLCQNVSSVGLAIAVYFGSITVQMARQIMYLPVILLSFAVPITCLILSLAPLKRKDYGIADGDASKANLKPALNIFYYLAAAQAACYILWVVVEGMVTALTVVFCKYHGYEQEDVDGYIAETIRKCSKDTALNDDWNLITYALDLLDSESLDLNDYCSGARILDTLIEQKVPVSQLLMQSSRQRIIQKLICKLGRRSPADMEARKLATRIVAHLAHDLSLADFPGTLDFVSSLLETHCYKPEQEALHLPPKENPKRNRMTNALVSMMDTLFGSKNFLAMLLELEFGHKHRVNIRQSAKEELILQGLRIVENLSHYERNCKEIYNNKDLLSKITAPLSSDKFMEAIEIDDGWVRVLNGSMKAVSRLMRAGGDVRKNMCQDIARNTNVGRKDISSPIEKSTVASNLLLVSKLESNDVNVLELQMGAIEILAQVISDMSISSDRQAEKEFINKTVIHYFLSEEWMTKYCKAKREMITKEIEVDNRKKEIEVTASPLINGIRLLLDALLVRRLDERKKKLVKEKMEEALETPNQLKLKAGEVLVLLSMGSQSRLDIIENITANGDKIPCLTKLLDSKIKIIECKISDNEIFKTGIKIGCRISAVEVLKHLWAHSTQPADRSVWKTVLKQVLEELLNIIPETESQTGNLSKGSTSAKRKNDEEDPPPPPVNDQDEPLTPESYKQQSDKRRFRAGLLSLYSAIRATWTDDAGNFASMVVELVASKDFAENIKAVIKENSYATPACLAMLKTISEMVILLMEHGHYIQDIRDKNIIDTLSEASKAMAGLESCMLFDGMNFDCYGIPLKPFSSVLVKKADDILKVKEQELATITPA